MTVEEFWQQFKAAHPEVTTNDYDAYAFFDADALAHLVKIGRKTATTSALELYDASDARPQVGEYNIVLDGQGRPVCVTQTKVVETIPFDQVSAEHAYHEGEGDRTLAYWRDVHRRVFKSFYHQMNREFSPI